MNDELIAALAAGDDAALRELFTRHAPWLAARLRAALPPPDVEDVLQETFLAWPSSRLASRNSRSLRAALPACPSASAPDRSRGGCLRLLGQRRRPRRGPSRLLGAISDRVWQWLKWCVVSVSAVARWCSAPARRTRRDR
jgi:hypothetical protein